MDSCARPRRTMDTHRSDVRSRRRSHSGQLLWQRPLGEPRATDRLGRLRAALCRRATLASRGLDSNFQFPAEIGFGFSRLRRLSAGVKVFAFHRNHPFCARAPEGANASRRGADRGTGRGNLERCPAELCTAEDCVEWIDQQVARARIKPRIETAPPGLRYWRSASLNSAADCWRQSFCRASP